MILLFAANLTLQTQELGSMYLCMRQREDKSLSSLESQVPCFQKNKNKNHPIGPCSSFKAKWGFLGSAAKANSSYSGTILKGMWRTMSLSAERKMIRPPVVFFFFLFQWLQAIKQVSTVKVWNKSKSLLLQIAKLPKLLNIKYLASDRVQFEHVFNQTLLLLSVEGRISLIQTLLLRSWLAAKLPQTCLSYGWLSRGLSFLIQPQADIPTSDCMPSMAGNTGRIVRLAQSPATILNLP